MTSAMETPRTRYLDHDGSKIAWQVFGDGPAELLVVPGWVSHVDLFWQYEASRAFLTELGSFARVAIYDKPGTGASDPVEAPPTGEERIEQLVGVMDAAELERPTVIGVSEGGATACLAAAARPDRVSRLAMFNATAALFDGRARGDMTRAEHAEWRDLIRRTALTWGEGRDGEIWLAGTPDPDDAWGRLQRACASPSVARHYYESWEDGFTAFDVLPAIGQPTLVISRTGDRVLPVKAARVAAQRIPNARMLEVPGVEHLPWLGDRSQFVEPLREFVGAPPPAPSGERVLAAVLFTDLVGSTERLAELGDARWREQLARHDDIVREGMARFDGRLVKHTGDGVLATFAGPARGTGAARWILDELSTQDLHARAGLHVGEVEIRGDDVAGLAVHVAARVMGQAGADEVLVSRTARDLTAGSGLRFEDRGTHVLKGLPDDWELFALVGPAG